MVKMPVVVGGKKKILNVLVDSGAQCDLIRLGLFVDHLGPPWQPMSFKMADGTIMRGGNCSIFLELAFEREILDGQSRVWTAQVEFFEAEIGCDAYLSYPTLRRLKMLIIADEGILARKSGRDRIDRLKPVFPPPHKDTSQFVRGVGADEIQQNKKVLCCNAVSAANKGKKKSGVKQDRGGRRGYKTPSEMPPIYIQQDRPPARDKILEVKKSAAAAVSSGDEKNRKKLHFSSQRMKPHVSRNFLHHVEIVKNAFLRKKG